MTHVITIPESVISGNRTEHINLPSATHGQMSLRRSRIWLLMRISVAATRGCIQENMVYMGPYALVGYNSKLLEERGIDGSRRGTRARPRPQRFFFFLNRLVPRTRRGISNFTKTRTRSRRVVFQKLSRALDRVRGLYRPHPPPKYSCKCGIWSLLETSGDTSGPEI